MAAIVIQVTGAPADASLAGALVASCSGATGGDGCALDTAPGAGPSGEEAPHVIVSFLDGTARVRVALDTSVREVTFREGDPPLERFRAAGLVVAGLVAEQRGPAPAGPAPLSALPPLPDEPAREVELALVARVSRSSRAHDEWLGATLGADFPLPGRVLMAALSVGYDRSDARSQSGVTEQRAALAVGPGVTAPILGGRVELRGRVSFGLSQLRADVVEPATGLTDAGTRTLFGVVVSADGDVALGPVLGLVVRGTLEGWNSETAIRVGGKTADVVPQGVYSLGVGLRARLP